jgi:hypothetical protein
MPLAVTALYAVGLALMMSRHEMWRDEIQAWLLARDSATPWALLHNIRYEGHPGLWHLLLWGPAHITANPAAMQVVHAVLATVSVFVLMRFAPFNPVTRIMLAFSYFFAYEWGVVSRNYAISVLLFFLFAALHRRRWAWFPLQAALLFAACHSNIHSILLVLALAPMLAVEYAVAFAGRAGDAQRVLPRVLAGFLVVGLGIATGIMQCAPPSDTGFAQGWRWKWTPELQRQTAGTVFNAALPLPSDNPRFWVSNRIVQETPSELLVSRSLLIIGLGCLFFLPQPWPVVPYLCGSGALLAFFHVKYPGAYRHHGFLFLWFLTLLWMTWDYRRWRLPWRWADMPVGLWNRFRDLALWPLLAVHVAGTFVSVKHDWREPFSNGKAAAAWLRQKYGDGAGRVFICDSSLEASTVVGYMPLGRIYHATRGEYGSYVIWNGKWRNADNLRNAVKRFSAGQTNELVLVLSAPAPNIPGANPVAAFTNANATTESYYLYTVHPAPRIP